MPLRLWASSSLEGGVYIFRASNAQKILFRENPDHPAFKDMPFIQTKRGTRLLTGGWWGYARHINYLGDWLQSLPFCLPLGGFLYQPRELLTFDHTREEQLALYEELWEMVS